MMKAAFRFLHVTGLWGFFVWLGSLLSWLIPLHNRSGLFFFFPYYHIGGAEKVHADIVACFRELRPWVIFTRRSQNDNYKSLFRCCARLFNLWFLGIAYPASIGLAAGFVNRHRDPVVFGCNSPFYYYLVPHLHRHVRKVDLTHAFDGLERLSLKVATDFDVRVVISAKTAEDFAAQYSAHGVDRSFLRKISLIQNRVDVPAEWRKKQPAGPLRVMYVGRGTPEKRAHLVGRAAASMAEKSIPAEFTLVGRGLLEALLPEDRRLCRFTGEIVDPAKLQALYADADVLVLTSCREGFPLVIMEAMANGVVPVSTNVGGISLHVTHGATGFLINETDEELVVHELVAILAHMSKDREELTVISKNAYEYAKAHFSPATFTHSYREAILGTGDSRNV